MLYGRDVSIGVTIERLMDEVGQWGFGYLLTVSDDSTTHLLALRPLVSGDVLRFDAGGGRASRNAEVRPQVSIVFPPASHSNGFSLVVNGEASVDGGFVDVRPTSAVLHRPAP
jgi:hypothetical protein